MLGVEFKQKIILYIFRDININMIIILLFDRKQNISIFNAITILSTACASNVSELMRI